jgi:hypothetical protein
MFPGPSWRRRALGLRRLREKHRQAEAVRVPASDGALNRRANGSGLSNRKLHRFRGWRGLARGEHHPTDPLLSAA